MQAGIISNSTFGLRISSRARDYFYEKFKNKPDKLLHLDKLEGCYPDDVRLDVDYDFENNSTLKKNAVYSLENVLTKKSEKFSLLTDTFRELEYRIKSFLKKS